MHSARLRHLLVLVRLVVVAAAGLLVRPNSSSSLRLGLVLSVDRLSSLRQLLVLGHLVVLERLGRITSLNPREPLVHSAQPQQLLVPVRLVAAPELSARPPNSNSLLQVVASLAKPNLSKAQALSGRSVTPTTMRLRLASSDSRLRNLLLEDCSVSRRTRLNSLRLVVDCLEVGVVVRYLGTTVSSNSSLTSQQLVVVSISTSGS